MMKSLVLLNKLSFWLEIIFLLVFSSIVLADFSQENISKSKEKAEIFLQQGDFENAIIQWADLAKEYADQGNTSEQAAILIKLANAYYSLGQYSASIERLEQANKLVKQSNNSQQKIAVMNSLGITYLALGEYPKANDFLQSCVDAARQNNETDLLIASLNNYGNLKVQEGEIKQALNAYSESTTLAQASGHNQLAAKSAVNSAIAAFKTEKRDKVGKLLDTAKALLEKTKNDHDKAFGWVSLGQIAQNLKNTEKTEWQSFAYHAFKQAETIGEQISDARATSYAKGYLGKLYMEEGRYEEALQLSRQAIFSIEKLQAPEILYQWQWQTGRILKAKGDNKTAILTYQQAVSTLHSIRQDLSRQEPSTSSFREEVGPIYLELADLLLQANDTLQEGEKYQKNLLEARNVIEQLKAAELQDYFNDDCVSTLQQKVKTLDSIDHQTAVVYPILLVDRVEILVSLPDGLKRFTVQANREDMINEVRLFRQKLENRTTREYLPHAQKLYQWLISPLQAELKEYKINTLVMVPDEFLRTIPLAALHDGESFLIEKYAIANTPGLNITDSKPISAENAKLLAVGLSESVQGFPALPHVATELKNINETFGGQILQDKSFQLNNVQKELKQTPYNIVHIASHGQFKSEAQENFVLTFDSKLNMDSLEQLIGLSRYRNEPIELLTLSACQTAAGDDRAALGLAGIAIKAGARSAVATLWFINDQAASTLVTEFYNQLKENKVTKAQAIKNAQVHLIKNTPYQHPYFWSPFLLIGNWL